MSDSKSESRGIRFAADNVKRLKFAERLGQSPGVLVNEILRRYFVDYISWVEKETKKFRENISPPEP